VRDWYAIAIGTNSKPIQAFGTIKPPKKPEQTCLAMVLQIQCHPQKMWAEGHHLPGRKNGISTISSILVAAKIIIPAIIA